MKVFSLFLTRKDLYDDLNALISLMRKKAAQKDGSDIAVVRMKRLPRKEEARFKRFIFIILPEHFINLAIFKALRTLQDEENHFTNLIFVTTRQTKKVKAIPSFTSYFNNLDFTPPLT